ncbi:MAG: hypothetical protein V3V99_13040 [candidate division Zixibacteria bacterium]
MNFPLILIYLILVAQLYLPEKNEDSKTENAQSKNQIDSQNMPHPIFSSTDVQSGVDIKWHVISSGAGITGKSIAFNLSSTIGQLAVGTGTSGTIKLSHGFLQYSAHCDCIPGEANGDGSINVGDAVYIINFVFRGGPAPIPYETCSGDANCDCECNIGDAVYIIGYIFKSGAPPCDCETWLNTCGLPLRN